MPKWSLQIQLSYLYHLHMPAVSHTCTGFHTTLTQSAVRKLLEAHQRQGLYPLLCSPPVLLLPSLGWQSTAAVARGAGCGHPCPQLQSRPRSDRRQGQGLNPTPALPRPVLLSPRWAASGYPQHSPGRERGSHGRGQSPIAPPHPAEPRLSGITRAAGTCLRQREESQVVS